MGAQRVLGISCGTSSIIVGLGLRVDAVVPTRTSLVRSEIEFIHLALIYFDAVVPFSFREVTRRNVYLTTKCTNSDCLLANSSDASKMKQSPPRTIYQPQHPTRRQLFHFVGQSRKVIFGRPLSRITEAVHCLGNYVIRFLPTPHRHSTPQIRRPYLGLEIRNRHCP